MHTHSLADKFLHRLILGSDAVSEFGYSIEKSFKSRAKQEIVEGRHAFVSGLARAGTTLITRELFSGGEFGSLTYRDMPFVVAPRLGRKLFGKRAPQTLEERAHGDGIFVDLESPEALEEPFWRMFDGESYIRRDRLVPHNPSPESLKEHFNYVGSVLSMTHRDRYLAKNNNSVLRLNALAENYPNADIIVPFRHPIEQSKSLSNQHKRFSELQRTDDFARKYMGWLVHHEFGLDHRPFDVGSSNKCVPTENQAYWLDLWCEVYQWLMETAPSRTRFICYEDYCNDADYRASFFAALNTPPPTPGNVRRVRPPMVHTVSNKGNLALMLYEKMRDRSATVCSIRN